MASAKSPTKAVLYIRVSSEQQVESGLGLAHQTSKLQAYCAMRGLEVAEIITDAGESAGKALEERPGGRRLLALIKRKRVNAVIALKLDRLFRRASDCLDVVDAWTRAGVSLHLVDLGGMAVDTSSATGKMFLTMLAGFAEFERNQVSERTKAALSVKRARGEALGGEAPYGYHYAEGRRVVPVPSEQAIIARAKALRAEGATLAAIAAQLTSDGLTNRACRPFAAQTVANMLREARPTAA